MALESAVRFRSDQALGGGVSNAGDAPVSGFVGKETGFAMVATSDHAIAARMGETEKQPWQCRSVRAPSSLPVAPPNHAFE